MSTIRFDVAGLSHVGLARANNEDALSFSAGLLAVSDGVGGRPAGEVASAIAVATFRQLAAAGASPADAVRGAADVVAAAAASNSLLSTMCCTLTAAVIAGARVCVAHVGDSRAFLLRDAELTVLTPDQTVAAKLLAAGEITAEEAAVHPKRNTMFHAVGSNFQPDHVFEAELDARPGDRLLLATDGLNYVPRKVVVAALVDEADPGAAAAALVDAALAVGAPDNVTVVVADVVEAAPGDLSA